MDYEREKKISKTIGKQIAYKRKMRRLTQEDVADRLGIGHEAVSRLERGTTMPTIGRLAELADVLDCGISDFLPHSSAHSADVAHDIARTLHTLSPQDRAAMLEIVEILAARMGTQVAGRIG